MPFCIVLTKEGSSELISLVPSTWVKDDDVLFWPRKRKNSDLELLRRDENSIPGENWKKMICKIKLKGITTFAEGLLKLEELYSNFEDTEDEETYYKNKKHSKNHPTFKFVSDDLMDLNASFDLIMENQKERSNDPEEDNITEEQTLHNNYIITENIETDNVTKVTTEENVTMNPDTVPEHNENFVTLKLDHLNSIISENRALTTENQILKESIQRFQNLEQDTKRGFAGIQIQLDKIFDFIKSKSFSNNDDMEANTQPIDDLIAQKNIEFPINSVKQLDSLENELTNANFEKALVKKFSTISGTSGHHKISKIGLQISKSFFNDELLNHFTWRGIKGCSKPPFMPYINIRNCFYKIIRLADNSCTALEADSFLQNSAIKHSGQRIKRKSCDMNMSKSKKMRTVSHESTVNENLDPMEDEIEDDTLGTTKCANHQSVQASKKVTVLSDVKINNKIMDLQHDSKMANISSANLINFQDFNENAQ